MGQIIRENADETESGLRMRDGQEMYRLSGVCQAAGTATSFKSTRHVGGGTAQFLITGGTDTGGGLLGVVNDLGYDIIVTAHQLDVTTKASAACTVSFGQTAVGITTSASNMINGQDVGTATGTFNGGALSVKVPNGQWITGSKATGASAGLVATAHFTWIPSLAAGAI